MPNVLYDHSTGEIRARAFDESDVQITNATLVCTLKDAHQRPATVFSGRAMPYNSGHAFTGPSDPGCYFCTVSSSEMSGPDGVWQAIITATDTIGNVLTINAYINVQPFVTA